MDKFLNKKYKVERCENLEEFLIELGRFCAKYSQEISLTSFFRSQFPDESNRKESFTDDSTFKERRRRLLAKLDSSLNDDHPKVQARGSRGIENERRTENPKRFHDGRKCFNRKADWG